MEVTLLPKMIPFMTAKTTSNATLLLLLYRRRIWQRRIQVILFSWKTRTTMTITKSKQLHNNNNNNNNIHSLIHAKSSIVLSMAKFYDYNYSIQNSHTIETIRRGGNNNSNNFSFPETRRILHDYPTNNNNNNDFLDSDDKKDSNNYKDNNIMKDSYLLP